MSIIEKIKKLEAELKFPLPESYRDFLIKNDVGKYGEKYFTFKYVEHYETTDSIEAFADVDSFWKLNEFRAYLVEFAEDLEVGEYVDGASLYHIAFTSNGSVCMSFYGKDVGKIYSVDNGDDGIVYLNNTLEAFLKTLRDTLL
mgnify:CR=1 FL=1